MLRYDCKGSTSGIASGCKGSLLVNCSSGCMCVIRMHNAHNRV